MTAGQANKNGGKYKQYIKDNESTKKDFHSFAANIVEQVLKIMKKSHTDEKTKENLNFYKFSDMNISDSDKSKYSLVTCLKKAYLNCIGLLIIII